MVCTLFHVIANFLGITYSCNKLHVVSNIAISLLLRTYLCIPFKKVTLFPKVPAVINTVDHETIPALLPCSWARTAPVRTDRA